MRGTTDLYADNERGQPTLATGRHTVTPTHVQAAEHSPLHHKDLVHVVHQLDTKLVELPRVVVTDPYQGLLVHGEVTGEICISSVELQLLYQELGVEGYEVTEAFLQVSPELSKVLDQSFVLVRLTEGDLVTLPKEFMQNMKKFPADDWIAVERSFAGDKTPEGVAGLLLECTDEDCSHVFLFHWTLNSGESLGYGIGLFVLKLFPLSLQRVPAMVERVPDDPGHLGQAGLGLVPQCGHVSQLNSVMKGELSVPA